MRLEIDIPLLDITSFDVYCGGVVVLIAVVPCLYFLGKYQERQLAKESREYLKKI
jgi:hypothetical protein